jgi:hypothetical protein
VARYISDKVQILPSKHKEKNKRQTYDLQVAKRFKNIFPMVFSTHLLARVRYLSLQMVQLQRSLTKFFIATNCLVAAVVYLNSRKIQ